MEEHESAIEAVCPFKFSYVIGRLREFFRNEVGFEEVPAQHRPSILAACEDPKTVATYQFEGQVWPLPQSGQMQLEFELLASPKAKGFFCQTTSYRNEPEPIPGRHNRAFPMFEFEHAGDLVDLERTHRSLLGFLGFPRKSDVAKFTYEEMASRFETRELTAQHEERMTSEVGSLVLLTHFPEYTSPFWNMKRDGAVAKKIDVILYGQETIGSAERSCDPKEMRDRFFSISDGEYAKMLFGKFTKRRVLAELDQFLSLPFIPRAGAGIGVNRLIRAHDMASLFPQKVQSASREREKRFMKARRQNAEI